jgi:hypothetical protein
MGPGFNGNRTARRACRTPHDRQMLAGAYWPVIAFAALLVTARITRWRRHRQEASIQ